MKTGIHMGYTLLESGTHLGTVITIFGIHSISTTGPDATGRPWPGAMSSPNPTGGPSCDANANIQLVLVLIDLLLHQFAARQRKRIVVVLDARVGMEQVVLRDLRTRENGTGTGDGSHGLVA